jgi:tripartite-type tricarboxylate transporter receptor subunit TctC
VRIISGVAAGGPGDVATRGAAQVLSQSLGQPFTVENRLGAEGMIAGEACARSTPDGYTLCMFDGWQVALNPAIRTKMPYDPARDLTPVMHLGFAAAAIIAHPSVPANSLQELFALAKAKPGSIAWGSSGIASPSNLYIEWLKNARGLQFHNVPYKSALQAMQAVLAGEIQVTSYIAGQVAPHVRAGKLKALAVPTSERSPYLPEVPTFKESGMDVALVTWFALMAPAGTPKDIIQRVNAEIAKDLFNNPAMREKHLTKPGTLVSPPAGRPPEAFAEFLKSQRELFASVVKTTGVRID